jgi:hypothetical protein
MEQIPKRSLSRISKIFLALTIGPFAIAGVVALSFGKLSAGIGLLAFSGLLAVFPLIGLFFLRHPVQGRSANLGQELENYKRQYPGWKGKTVYYGLVIAFLVVIFLRLAGLVA